MAYQNGTASSPTDLLQKLAAWLSTVGWTQDMSQADGTGWRLHMHKGSDYINLRSFIVNTAADCFDNYHSTGASGIWLYMGSGFNSGNTWKTQPGGPIGNALTYTVGAGCPMGPGAISGYHFFTTDANNDNVVVVLEKSAGVFTHFGWGRSLEKLGTWTGGPYFFSTCDTYRTTYTYSRATAGYAQNSAYPPGTQCDYPNFYVRADVDAFVNKWIAISNNVNGSQGYTGKCGASVLNWGSDASWLPMITTLPSRLTNTLNGQSLLLPIRVGARRDAGGTSLIGNLPGIFLTNACQKGYTPATVYQWATDNYMVFPGPSDDTMYGYAVKKV